MQPQRPIPSPAFFALLLLTGMPSRAFASGEQFAAEVAQRESCARVDMLCLDDHGRGYAGDTAPAQMAAGSVLGVKVLGCKAENAGRKFKLEDSVVHSLDRLFKGEAETKPDDKKDMAAGEREDPCPLAENIVLLEPGRFVLPTDVSVKRFTVTFSRVKAATGDIPEAIEAVESHTTSVTHGRYYLDVGVLIPVVLGGTREVVADDTDQPNVKRLRVRTDVQVFPALMLHFFPGGREFGTFSSFNRGLECGPGRIDLGKCRALRHRRRAANSLGIQAGIELDFKKLSRLYFGGLFEPVSGFSINVGVALTRLQYIRGGYYEGGLISKPTVVHADGSPDLSQYIEQKWAPRFYLGITLSLDILRYLSERRRSDDLGSVLPK